uniref:Uncharacterized protein n=1 Tax=Moniliophthora roreri TaxID=221103 RepID=A0A0W0EW29_MONRR
MPPITLVLNHQIMMPLRINYLHIPGRRTPRKEAEEIYRKSYFRLLGFLVKHGRVPPTSTIETKAARKGNHSEMGPTPVRQYRRYQDLESRVLLHDFIEHGCEMAEGPINILTMILWIDIGSRSLVDTVVMIAMYGERVHAIRGNESLSTLYEILENVTTTSIPEDFSVSISFGYADGSVLTQAAYRADTFTFMQYLPDVLPHGEKFDRYGSFLKRIEADHEAGINRADCFVDKYLKAREASMDEIVSGGGVSPRGWIRDLLLTYVAGSAIEAGSSCLSLFRLK